MTCCVFAGPTLAAPDRARLGEAVWLPPAQQGDVYRVVTHLQPRVIGLIDGYFQWVPAVWHKEILWALHCGIHVFGASSMGALRAAELAPYGMRGVGRIFEAYRGGTLAPFDDPFEDDDEVALVHGPEEAGFVAASEAMVNIRATLIAAVRANIISLPTLHALAGIAKALYFPQRNYDRVLAQARTQDLPGAELDAFEAFLPQGRIDQKRLDAIELLDTLNAFMAADPAPGSARFRFEHTTLWDRVVRSLAQSAPHSVSDQQVLTEARLEGKAFVDLWHCVLDELLDPGGRLVAANVSATSDGAGMAARARARAMQRDGARIPAAVIERHVLQRLETSGRYATLLQRAADKAARLRGEDVAAEVSRLDPLQLLQLEDWYFAACLDTDIPEDLPGYIAQTGYADQRAFHEAIFAEYLYRRSGDDPGGDAAVSHPRGDMEGHGRLQSKPGD